MSKWDGSYEKRKKNSFVDWLFSQFRKSTSKADEYFYAQRSDSFLRSSLICAQISSFKAISQPSIILNAVQFHFSPAIRNTSHSKSKEQSWNVFASGPSLHCEWRDWTSCFTQRHSTQGQEFIIKGEGAWTLLPETDSQQIFKPANNNEVTWYSCGPGILRLMYLVDFSRLWLKPSGPCKVYLRLEFADIEIMYQCRFFGEFFKVISDTTSTLYKM